MPLFDFTLYLKIELSTVRCGHTILISIAAQPLDLLATSIAEGVVEELEIRLL